MPQSVATQEPAGADGGTRDRATRERLLEAAVEVFAEKGYEGARVSDIARRAGLTTGAIYAQFVNKADLLREAIESSSAQGLDTLMLGQAEGVGAAGLLAEMGRQLVGSGSPDWVEGLLVEALVAARRDPVVAERLRVVLQAQGQELSALFEAGQQGGDFDRKLDVRSAVRFCTALSLGMLLLGSVGLDPPDANGWNDLIARLVQALKS